MSQFYIIHLSDLHIVDTITTTLSNLIRSISQNKELQNKNVFLVITGDIINQGNYEKYFDSALKFFENLKKGIERGGINILDIHIVPGNHDKSNNATNKLFSIAQQTGIKFPLDELEQKANKLSHIPLEKEVLALQCVAFEKHIELCNKIFELFELRNRDGELKKYEKTFGVESNVIGVTSIAFIRMNTALSCNGTPNDNEKYHLTIGETQCNYLKDMYASIKDEAHQNEYSLITFCLAHHPTMYMTPNESNNLNSIILAEDGLNVDYILTGHVHDAAINNLSDHIRNVISLETGIGWQDEIGVHHKEHRYAIYSFDEEKSVFSSTMYKTNQANCFEIDTDYLLTEEEKKCKKIFSPLKTRDFAFIDISSKSAAKDFLFVSGESMSDLKSLYVTITDFSAMCERTFLSYKSRYVDYLLQDDLYKSETLGLLEKSISLMRNGNYKNEDFSKACEEIFSYKIKENHDKVRWLFKSYLQHITDLFVKYFNQYFNQSDSESRAVFRVYSRYEDECVPICMSPKEIEPRREAKENTTGYPRNFKYEGSLIEYSYKNNESVIYSINRDKNNFTSENWDDFITIVPTIKGNAVNISRGKKIPILSFVYSIRIRAERLGELTKKEIRQLKKEQTCKLLLFQFTNIENILVSAIQKFTGHFGDEIDADELLKKEDVN